MNRIRRDTLCVGLQWHNISVPVLLRNAHETSRKKKVKNISTFLWTKQKKEEIVQNLEHGLFQASLVSYKQNKKCVFQALNSTQKNNYLGWKIILNE